MGEARKRGTTAQRETAAIARAKRELIAELGGFDENVKAQLSAGFSAFRSRLTAQEWAERRAKIVAALLGRETTSQLATAPPIRVQSDEIAWYMFLCEQAIDDPLCTDIAQSQRALPFFAGIGARWAHAHRVKGIDRKIDDALGGFRDNPDGLIFEINVALAYAAEGWDVTFIPEGGEKSPDMLVTRGTREFYVECKRMGRRTDYAEEERNQFLRIWDEASNLLLQNRQWLWLHGTFHVEMRTLPLDFLKKIFAGALPLRAPGVIHASAEATIRARRIDQRAVHAHLASYRVKDNSPSLIRLLGGDWAPDNSQTTIKHVVRFAQLAHCEVPALGRYIDEIAFACGFTREFDSPQSIQKKSRDIIKLLSNAVAQLPTDRPSIIHIAAETMEGRSVEHKRTERVLSKMAKFVADKPVASVRFHRLQANMRADLLFEMDETVDKFQSDRVDLSGIPPMVVVAPDTSIRSGAHWDLYE